MKMFEFNPLVQPLVDKADYCGLMLIPRKIFYEWSRYIIPEKDFFNQQEEELFLLPPFDSIEKAEEFLRLFFDLFFQYKLRKCSHDPAYWPINRSYEMFEQWFEIKISSNISRLK